MKVCTPNAKLCENCRYGYDSFLMDNKNPFCRFKNEHHGESCDAYIKYMEVNQNDEYKL